MKKLLFFLAVILFIPFRVNALTDPVYFQSPIPANVSISFNNYAWSTTTFQTVTANSTYHFDLYGAFSTGMQYDSVYVRVSYCVDGSFTKGYSTDQNTIDIDSIRTNIPCEYYGSNYSNGRVAFTTWRYNTAGNASFTTRISFNAGSSNISIGLLGVDLSLSQFPLYSETDAILKSNDSINSRLLQVIDSNNNILYSVNDTNTLLQQLIENQKVCTDYNFSLSTIPVGVENAFLESTGNIHSNYQYTNISDYIRITTGGTYTLNVPSTGSAASYCLYNENKEKISCTSYGSSSSFSITPSNIGYIRFSYNKSQSTTSFVGRSCLNGNQAVVEQQQQSNQIQQERNDFMNNDNVDESSSTGSSFFNSFNTSDHGLTGIITAPLNLISSITSKTCSPLVLPLPFVNQNLSLPCMSSIYSQYFGSFYDIYKVITFGIVAYWICIRIFAMVKDFKNPEHDEIEVVDL